MIEAHTTSQSSGGDEWQPTLAVQASLAAITLDRLSRGQQVDLDPVRRLATMLRATIEAATGIEAPPAAGLRIGLTTAGWLSPALTIAGEGQSQSVSDVAKRATAMLSSLSLISDTDSSKAPELRDLCIALSQGAQGQDLMSRRSPRHPYRR